MSSSVTRCDSRVPSESSRAYLLPFDEFGCNLRWSAFPLQLWTFALQDECIAFGVWSLAAKRTTAMTTRDVGALNTMTPGRWRASSHTHPHRARELDVYRNHTLEPRLFSSAPPYSTPAVSSIAATPSGLLPSDSAAHDDEPRSAHIRPLNKWASPEEGGPCIVHTATWRES
jgi:hypothetical protein